MTQTAVDCLLTRFQAVTNEIDIKAEGLKGWQSAELHRLAEKAESVLGGCRRKNERRG